MNDSPPPCHILALDVTGPPLDSAHDLRLSLAIVSELLVSCETCVVEKSRGQLITYPVSRGLFALFLQEQTAPVRCAVELWELLQEIPSLPVRMAIHSGVVETRPDAGGVPTASGEGIDAALSLLETAEGGQILLSESYAESLGSLEGWAGSILTPGGAADAKSYRIEPQKLVFLDGAEAASVVDLLETALAGDGHETTHDRKEPKGVAWAKAMESRIRSADAVVAIVPGPAAESDLLQYQLEIAVDERRKRGRPQIVPVWLKEGPMPNSPLAALNQNLHHAVWLSAEDNDRVVSQVRAALAIGPPDTVPERLDAAGGAISGSSKFYVLRPADKEFEEALGRHEGIVLVKGPRQIGKTSLIGRGIEFVEEQGWRCATTDFQKLYSGQLESADSFCRVVARTLCRQLGFDYDFAVDWQEDMGPNLNMDGFVRALLSDSDRPLVWFIDEADRLFGAPFASDFFGLVRSWHNARATDRRGPWNRLTIVIGYATEAHLFIKDLNQSPFNVGCAIDMAMFTLANTVDLNERYGRSITRPEDVRALFELLGGHPFLTRRAFDVLAKGKMSVETLFATAARDDGPFGDHLKRVLVSVTVLPTVWDALVQSLTSVELPESEGLQRLIAAGVLVRNSDRGYVLPCPLYRRYLSQFAAEVSPNA